MADRGPDPIERMAEAHYVAEMPGRIEWMQLQPWQREARGKAMIAAVRELYWCQIERGEKHHCMAAACMLEVIEDHERRSEGKA